MSGASHLELADRFVRAIEAGDEATIRAIYAPDAQIWHNHDNADQSVGENLRVLRWLIRTLSSRHYRVLRREALSNGFLQQHVLEGVLPDGRPFALPACIVCTVVGGRIARLEEYLDIGGARPLQAFAASR